MIRLRKEFARRLVSFGWLSLVAVPVMIYVSGESVSRDQWILRAAVTACAISGIVVWIVRRWRSRSLSTNGSSGILVNERDLPGRVRL